MSKFHRFTFASAALFCSLAFAAAAQAQTAQRTFVSTSGSDTNTASLCSAQNPCRSFTSALTVTTAGGEIIALTSGGYGAVTINKSVQINAPTGVYVAITKIGAGDAITVNTSNVVVLRGLTLVGLSGASVGINVVETNAVHVENCVIQGFVDGIRLTDFGDTYVKDTVIRNNSGNGIFVDNDAESGTAKALIDNCRLERNFSAGINVTQRAQVTARNTIATGGDYGFIAQSVANFGGAAESNLTLENCTATDNDEYGMAAFNGNGGSVFLFISSSTVTNNVRGIGSLGGANSIVRVSNTNITQNTTGLVRDSGSALSSYGNNRLVSNRTDGAFGATLSQQ